jgi:hypothetical protein
MLTVVCRSSAARSGHQANRSARASHAPVGLDRRLPVRWGDEPWAGSNSAVAPWPAGRLGLIVAEPHASAIRQADEALRYTAAKFYTNDKPTGSVVGQQPFGGARASGTNDKAGTVWNMIRFASPRSTKRNHLPAHDYRYPHLEP